MKSKRLILVFTRIFNIAEGHGVGMYGALPPPLTSS